MKTLNITFTDAEFKKLKKAKKLYNEKHNSRYGWRDFILVFARGVSVRYARK